MFIFIRIYFIINSNESLHWLKNFHSQVKYIPLYQTLRNLSDYASFSSTLDRPQSLFKKSHSQAELANQPLTFTTAYMPLYRSVEIAWFKDAYLATLTESTVTTLLSTWENGIWQNLTKSTVTTVVSTWKMIFDKLQSTAWVSPFKWNFGGAKSSNIAKYHILRSSQSLIWAD